VVESKKYHPETRVTALVNKMEDDSASICVPCPRLQANISASGDLTSRACANCARAKVKCVWSQGRICQRFVHQFSGIPRLCITNSTRKDAPRVIFNVPFLPFIQGRSEANQRKLAIHQHFIEASTYNTLLKACPRTRAEGRWNSIYVG